MKVCPFGSPIEAVMTAAEAAERWGIGAATVKHACSGQHGNPPRFTDKECRKSKGVWLVTTIGMKRLWGKEPKEEDLKEARKAVKGDKKNGKDL